MAREAKPAVIKRMKWPEFACHWAAHNGGGPEELADRIGKYLDRVRPHKHVGGFVMTTGGVCIPHCKLVEPDGTPDTDNEILLCGPRVGFIRTQDLPATVAAKEPNPFRDHGGGS